MSTITYNDFNIGLFLNECTLSVTFDQVGCVNLYLTSEVHQVGGEPYTRQLAHFDFSCDEMDCHDFTYRLFEMLHKDLDYRFSSSDVMEFLKCVDPE